MHINSRKVKPFQVFQVYFLKKLFFQVFQVFQVPYEPWLYINKRPSCKTHPDLAIYRPKKVESIFVEVVLSKKSNLTVRCICTFNDLSLLLDNLSKEASETIVLLGAFNIDLSNFDTSEHVSTFLDDLASNSLQP